MSTRADRHLRPRGEGGQETTAVELFFDLVYALAVTQLSHLVLAHHLDLTVVWRMGFLLLVVWWAWVYTTWMVNWLDPGSVPVRLLVVGGALASLLMAAALPGAFGRHGLLFAAAYCALQVGRNLGGALILRNDHPLGDAFRRFLAWSLVASVPWLAGALVPGPVRIALWGPALAIELIAPLTWYWMPGRGPMRDGPGQSIEGSHFAERFQGLVIIVLGESIAVTGASAAQAGLTATEVAALTVGFLQASALWWLYFGAVAANSRRRLATAEDPVTLARDAYTYLHLPIVGGVILSAVGAGYIITHPDRSLSLPEAIITLAGPVLFLGGEVLFRLRMIRRGNPKRLLAVAALAALTLLHAAVSALVLGLLELALLTGLGVWEYGRPGSAAGPTTPPPADQLLDERTTSPVGSSG